MDEEQIERLKCQHVVNVRGYLVLCHDCVLTPGELVPIVSLGLKNPCAVVLCQTNVEDFYEQARIGDIKIYGWHTSLDRYYRVAIE